MTMEQHALTQEAGVKVCGCGCDTPVGKRSSFAPGHDARMVSNVVAVVVDGGAADAPALRQEPSLNEGDGYAQMDIAQRIKLAAQAIEQAFSSALAIKFDNAAHKAWSKAVGTANDTETKSGRTRKPRAAKPKDAAKRLSAAVEIGKVRIGRWTYEAKRHDDGTVVWTNKKGEEFTADKKVADTFAA